MALTTAQIAGIALGTAATAGLVGLGIRQARASSRAREQRKITPSGPARPTCPAGLSPRMVDGEWQCLPVTAQEECIAGVYSAERNALPDSIVGLLGENALKTADQFYGFHLSPEAMEDAYTAFAAQIPNTDEAEGIYHNVLEDLMPCRWPLGITTPAPGAAALVGWPLDFNFYLDPPAPVTDRMEKSARSLSDLWIVAISQHLDQFLPVDVDPVMAISDPQRDLCARADVLDPRASGAPTSEGVILGALTVAGFDPQTQNVDQIMAQLEAENPLLLDYLEADWRIPAETQDTMWQIMLEVANYPRPVTNTVFNTQKGDQGACPWDEKDGYTISMATFWYSAKRIAAIAELAGGLLPVIVKEG